MTQEIKRQITRYRCDYCRKLVHWMTEPVIIHDTVTGKTLHACNGRCSANWFAREYQLPLDLNPSSNTGVILCTDGQTCDLGCDKTAHCFGGNNAS